MSFVVFSLHTKAVAEPHSSPIVSTMCYVGALVGYTFCARQGSGARGLKSHPIKMTKMRRYLSREHIVLFHVNFQCAFAENWAALALTFTALFMVMIFKTMCSLSLFRHLCSLEMVPRDDSQQVQVLTEPVSGLQASIRP